MKIHSRFLKSMVPERAVNDMVNLCSSVIQHHILMGKIQLVLSTVRLVQIEKVLAQG